ncbi:MAG: long-chain-fatty-acid--CoA ligase [Rhodococcus sp.]|uniref:long-chain-fatty-acid--CoA ligase n=1 Tax=Rhodococcus TaxID=1827 RepID=UPI00169E1D89|nr:MULTISPECIES: long-chain-fatty-acid--CoA ligase [Rhodococcus]NLV77915.1 long-chain-fatty-acid--CoA ligase [Rhodococcus sp. (in: high G+C Gram-positive bacteria)]
MAAPSPTILLDRVAHWARTIPHSPAVEHLDRSHTWSDWHARLRRLAGALAAAGIGPGDTVAFVDKNNLACLEVTYAASALGAANAVPNFRLADDEMTYVLRDANARILFVGAEFADAISGIRPHLGAVEKVVVVGGEHDEFDAFLASGDPAFEHSDVDVDTTALLLYSSGTTGRPKGVQLTHRNLAAHADAVLSVLPFRDDDCLLVAMPLFHVGGSCYAIMGLHDGRRCVFTREADAPSLFAGIAAGANIAFVVPPVIAGVLAAGEPAISAFGRLTRITYGAAPMPLPLLRAALAAWPDTEFVQVYGMTELAGVITALLPDVHRDPTQETRMASAGTPLPGIAVRVVDPATNTDVEPGRVGELWWKSEQTTPGYLGRPDATREAIVEDGWLRSGDMGRVDDGGFVFVEDRLKDMIISGGENVYCPEVERVLVEHPAVADVAVIGVPDEKWGETVKAVVVLTADREADESELLDHTRAHLAKFKCPTSIDIVDELPRNPTGKILKRTLRAPYWQGRERSI